MDNDDRRQWLDLIAALDGPAPPILAAVGCQLAEPYGRTAEIESLIGAEPAAGLPSLPAGAGPGLLGQAHEVLAAADEQRTRGAWYTPEPVAFALVGAVLDGMHDRPLRICDPAVGGGVFLLAVAEHQVAAGFDPAEVAAGLHGADIDPLAVRVARAVLALWAAARGLDWGLADQILVADTLLHRPPDWDPGSFDAVVGNPPFLGQLSSDTARSRDRAVALAVRWGSSIPPYVDDSALFLLLGGELLAEGGQMVLIQPQSVLAARDAGPIRAAVAEQLNLAGLWLTAEAVFGSAAVRVCAPMLSRAAATNVALWEGNPPIPAGVSPNPSEPARWVEVAARARGVPPVSVRGSRTLGDVADLVAGFRDEYYGLVPAVQEDTGEVDRRPLVTSGQIDPGRLVIDSGGVRFAKQAWRRPVVDPDLVTDPRARAWLTTTRGPKVLVASQTRVIEAVVDPRGDLLPSTPVVAAMPTGWEPHEIAAVLNSPWATAWLVGRAVGTGLAVEAVRVSAGQLAELPLPPDRGALGDTADLLAATRAALTAEQWSDALLELARVSNRAYRVAAAEANDLTAWWVRRLPKFRVPPPP
ncbi:MAG: N-6 DNA methylase [Actinomycetia bacterium]|nr:N-6 DNA methylase [Actinomycetes bacterium]